LPPPKKPDVELPGVKSISAMAVEFSKLLAFIEVFEECVVNFHYEIEEFDNSKARASLD